MGRATPKLGFVGIALALMPGFASGKSAKRAGWRADQPRQ